MRFLGSPFDRPVKDELMSYLPDYYADSKVVNEIMRVDAYEMEKYYESILNVLNQRFINSSEDAVDRWLNEFGIKEPSPVPTEAGGYEPYNRTLNEKRALLLLQMRSSGTVTRQMLSDICSIYGGGDVEIIEDFAIGKITIKFLSIYGSPLRLADLTQALRMLLPAHYDFEYVYRYSTWNEINGKNYTWTTIDSKNLLWNSVDNGGLSV